MTRKTNPWAWSRGPKTRNGAFGEVRPKVRTRVVPNKKRKAAKNACRGKGKS